MRNYTFELTFNAANAGTVVEKDFDAALRSAMFQLGIDRLNVAEVECKELNVRNVYRDPILRNNSVWCELKYGYEIQHPYNKPDGLRVWSKGRVQCDHSGLMKYRTCFRPIHTTYYADDALGWATPVSQMCRVHSGTDATEVGYHD